MEQEQIINRLDYLKQTHADVRKEIQNRIKQRDTFAIQFVVATGAILTVGMLDFSYSPFLFFLLPLIALFYSIQILYSYTIHDRCHKFLAEEIEPEIGRLLSLSRNEEDRLSWERYCDIQSKAIKVKAPGIRKKFFEVAIFVVPLVSSALFFGLGCAKNLLDWQFLLIISISALVFFDSISAVVVYRFNKK